MWWEKDLELLIALGVLFLFVISAALEFILAFTVVVLVFGLIGFLIFVVSIVWAQDRWGCRGCLGIFLFYLTLLVVLLVGVWLYFH